MTQQLPDYVREHTRAATFTRLQRVTLLVAHLRDEAVTTAGLTWPEFTMLATLRRHPRPHRLPVVRLAELVVVPLGSITNLVDRLVGRNLVRRARDAEDRRKVLVELTQSGIRTADQAQEAYEAARDRVLNQLGDDEMTAVDQAVAVLLEAFEADRLRRRS